MIWGTEAPNTGEGLMGSEEVCEGPGKGTVAAWDPVSKACFPSLPAGEAGKRRPGQKESH